MQQEFKPGDKVKIFLSLAELRGKLNYSVSDTEIKEILVDTYIVKNISKDGIIYLEGTKTSVEINKKWLIKISEPQKPTEEETKQFLKNIFDVGNKFIEHIYKSQKPKTETDFRTGKQFVVNKVTSTISQNNLDTIFIRGTRDSECIRIDQGYNFITIKKHNITELLNKLNQIKKDFE